MWGKRKKAGGGRRRSSNRTCPFCETENPSGATTCYQCYYELDVKAMHQSASKLEEDKDTLWGELIQEVMPGTEEDYSVSVITMDEMAVEVDEYETVGDDEVIIMSQGGPSFAEIMDSEVSAKEESVSMEDALAPASSPVISRTEAVIEDAESANITPPVPVSSPQPAIVTPPAPAQTPALIPPPIPSIELDLLSSDDEIDDDLDAIIAAAKPHSTQPVDVAQVQGDTSPPTVVATTASVLPPAIVPPPAIMLPPTIAPPPATVPPPAIVPPTAVETPPPPAIVPSSPAIVNGAIPPSIPASAPANAIPTSNAILNSNNIWPWPQSEPWDDRVLRRDIIEAMEAAQRGDRQAAGAALDRLGPHLGNRFDALHHIGALLHSLGRGEQMKAMILVAQKTHPDDPNVSTAAAALLQS